jgi:hypothetical protein
MLSSQAGYKNSKQTKKKKNGKRCFIHSNYMNRLALNICMKNHHQSQSYILS